MRRKSKGTVSGLGGGLKKSFEGAGSLERGDERVYGVDGSNFKG